MAQQEMFLKFFVVGASGLPQDATFRLESQMALEIQCTILTAAAMLCLDATEDSYVRQQLSIVNTKIAESGTEIRKSWLDLQSDLQARLDTALAWHDGQTSVVFSQGNHQEVVWQGSLKALALVAYALSADKVKVRPSTELSKRVLDWPVPVPANAKVQEAPKSAAKAVQAETETITPADLPGASVAPEIAPVQAAADNGVEAAKAKAKAAKALTLEEKVNKLVNEGLSVAEARKKARTM